MTTVNYTYTVLSVGDRTIDVRYSHPTYGDLIVGVRRPKLGETTAQVVEEYAPVAFWLEMNAPLEPVVARDGGAGSVFIPDAPVPPTPAQQLATWRAGTTISRFQAHETLRTWGLYDQVVAIVAGIGNPVERAFYDAGIWMRNSGTIITLFSLITMPDGNPPTEETLDQFFTEASEYVL